MGDSIRTGPKAHAAIRFESGIISRYENTILELPVKREEQKISEGSRNLKGVILQKGRSLFNIFKNRLNGMRQFDLEQILKHLHRRGVTGSLILRNKEAMKCIYLKRGKMIFAASNLPEDRLGEILLRLGKISPQQLQFASKRHKEEGKKLGAILVEAGFITPKELFEGLKNQVREIISSLIQWEEGEYLFIDQKLPDNVISLKLDTTDLISVSL
jgi:ribosomal protein L30E